MLSSLFSFAGVCAILLHCCPFVFCLVCFQLLVFSSWLCSGSGLFLVYRRLFVWPLVSFSAPVSVVVRMGSSTRSHLISCLIFFCLGSCCFSSQFFCSSLFQYFGFDSYPPFDSVRLFLLFPDVLLFLILFCCLCLFCLFFLVCDVFFSFRLLFSCRVCCCCFDFFFFSFLSRCVFLYIFCFYG